MHFTIAIKVGDTVRQRFDLPNSVQLGIFVQADSAQFPETTVLTRPGTELPVMLAVLAETIGRLPIGSEVSLLSDYAALPSAWSEGWLDKWRSEDFRGKKPAHPDEWRELDRIISAREIALSVRQPETPEDRGLLKALRSDIERGRALQPGESEDSKGGYDDTDAAMRRAMDRDRDPF